MQTSLTNEFVGNVRETEPRICVYSWSTLIRLHVFTCEYMSQHPYGTKKQPLTGLTPELTGQRHLSMHRDAGTLSFGSRDNKVRDKTEAGSVQIDAEAELKREYINFSGR